MPVVEIKPYTHSAKRDLLLHLTHSSGQVNVSCALADRLLSSGTDQSYRVLLYDRSATDAPEVWKGEIPTGEWAALAFDVWQDGVGNGMKVTPYLWQDKAKGKSRAKYRGCSRWLQEYLFGRFPTDPKAKSTVYALKPELSFEHNGLTFYVIQPKQPKQRKPK